jgi:hypothetical protein
MRCELIVPLIGIGAVRRAKPGFHIYARGGFHRLGDPERFSVGVRMLPCRLAGDAED